MVCPLCHKAHQDPPDIGRGRVRVCEACHPTKRRKRQPRPSDPKNAGPFPPAEPIPPIIEEAM